MMKETKTVMKKRSDMKVRNEEYDVMGNDLASYYCLCVLVNAWTSHPCLCRWNESYVTKVDIMRSKVSGSYQGELVEKLGSERYYISEQLYKGKR